MVDVAASVPSNVFFADCLPPNPQRLGVEMRESIAHPGSVKPQTPRHNARATVGFAHQPTGRFKVPKPPPPGAFQVPGPGSYQLTITRRGADMLTNSAKPTFGKEEQRPDVEKEIVG